MKFARCPACQTVFRVRPEQLSARLGEVRCGHCFNPFNALDHLLAEAEAQQGARTAAERSDATHPADNATAVPEPSATAAATPPQSVATNEFHDPALDFEIPEVWRSPRAQLQTEADKPQHVEPTRSVVEEPPLFDDTRVPSGSAKPAPPDDFQTEDFSASFTASLAAAGAGRIEPGRTEPAVAPAAPPAPEESLPTAAAPKPDRAEPSELPPAWQASTGADGAEEHFDARYGPKPGAAPGRRWLWSLGVGVMLGALVVQSSYIFRLEITRSMPVLRPLYLAACAQLGCTLPLPRDAEHINIAASDLQSDLRATGSYVLDATVRNRASYPQEWPHLELTLTDAQDRALVRRVLDPGEWAQAETAKLRAGFPAGREQAVELRFDAPGVQAVGYRLYIFYP